MLEALVAAVEVMCRIGLAVPGRVPRAPLPSDQPHRELRRRGRRGQALRAHRGPARPRLRHLRQPGRRHHRVPRRRLVDEAPAPRMGRPRRRRRRRSSPAPASPGRSACSRASTASTRRSPAATTPRGSPRSSTASAACGRSSSSPTSRTRAARSRSRTWTARRGCASATASGRGRSSSIVCETAAGPVPRLWEPLAAKHRAAERLRGEVQPAVPDRVDPDSRPGRPRRVHRRGRARTSRCCAWPGASRYELDPTHRLPAAVRRATCASRSPDGRVVEERQDRPARRARRADDARRARGEVPRQRRAARCPPTRSSARSTHGGAAGAPGLGPLVAALTPWARPAISTEPRAGGHR